MRVIEIAISLTVITLLTSCASGYNMISPQTISYASTFETNGVILEYKYDLLNGKYAKKEDKKAVKVTAIKITNNSDRDLIFGRDIKLIYQNGNEVYPLENEKVFTKLKQGTASYLWYLLLTPFNIFYYSGTSNGVEDYSFIPVGLIIGPGLAGGNMIASGSANKKFKSEMILNEINGEIIKSGETKYGLIGINSNSFDVLQLKIE